MPLQNGERTKWWSAFAEVHLIARADMKIQEAIARIEKHEAECSLRYEEIQRRLEDGKQKMDKLDANISANFKYLVGVIIATALVPFVERLF